MPDHFTTRLHLPYPDLDDPADVPADLQQLAEAIDALSGVSAPGGPGAPLIAAPVLDVGLVGQIRAGRALTVADFATLCGLPTVPVGLFNLSDLTNLGSGGPLVNKGAVPFGLGINGLAASAAVFAGSTGQALYIADTGAADPFRLRTGSWAAWSRTAKRSTSQAILSKWASGASQWWLGIANNVASVFVSSDGSSSVTLSGVTDVADDRWHHLVATHDGTYVRIYVDGALDGVLPLNAQLATLAAPLNIGSQSADGATAATSPHYGRVDEAFVTPDVLTEEQVRLLYCAKIAHALGAAPSRALLNVRRRRKGGAFAVADFPAQPVRLHNFTAGSLVDEGSNGVALATQGAPTPTPVAGPAGTKDGAMGFAGGSGSLSATDAGLPAALTTRSYGCWFKTGATGTQVAVAWGTPATAHVALYTGGGINAGNGSDNISGPFVADGQWHLAVVVEDNAAGDGLRRKLYLDGRLVGGSTVLNAITLAGANRFRVGAQTDGTLPWTGQIDGAFVYAGALTMEQIAALYAKGVYALPPSPKEIGAHVEAMDATNVYATFDTLDSQHQIDLGVAA